MYHGRKQTYKNKKRHRNLLRCLLFIKSRDYTSMSLALGGTKIRNTTSNIIFLLASHAYQFFVPVGADVVAVDRISTEHVECLSGFKSKVSTTVCGAGVLPGASVVEAQESWKLSFVGSRRIEANLEDSIVTIVIKVASLTEFEDGLLKYNI